MIQLKGGWNTHVFEHKVYIWNKYVVQTIMIQNFILEMLCSLGIGRKKTLIAMKHQHKLREQIDNISSVSNEQYL